MVYFRKEDGQVLNGLNLSKGGMLVLRLGRHYVVAKFCGAKRFYYEKASTV